LYVPGGHYDEMNIIMTSEGGELEVVSALIGGAQTNPKHYARLCNLEDLLNRWMPCIFPEGIPDKLFVFFCLDKTLHDKTRK